ncbi:hypothetical protein GOODEAATRI_028267 [Goodea atripinnis]|uniref:Uncharacterized protein n=1 Tax=Goodea atripinnis TaxID=208336 RepID=A0ABV0NYD5_9TELE
MDKAVGYIRRRNRQRTASGAQACPASATSSTSLPPRDAGVSVQLDDPTDEELLEATAEQRGSTRDPPEPATVEDVDALFRQDPPPPADGAEMLPVPGGQLSALTSRSGLAGRCLAGIAWVGLVSPPTSTCGGTADLPPASMHWIHDKGWAVQDPPEVSDIDGWYLMATDHLECPVCATSTHATCPVTSMAADGVRLRCGDAAGGVQGQDHVHLRIHFEDGFHQEGLKFCQSTAGAYKWWSHSLAHSRKHGSVQVTKKLAGAGTDTAAWVTNVGNEYGQVLMSVLTCSEGSEGLDAMAARLTGRYRVAEVPPPVLMYVDRDCCNRDGVSKTAALFHVRTEMILGFHLADISAG